MTEVNVVCQRGEHFRSVVEKSSFSVSGDKFRMGINLKVSCSNVNLNISFEFHRRFSLKLNFNISH